MSSVETIIFETERLKVRPYTMDDLDHFYLLNGNPEVMRYIRPAQTFEQTKDFLQKIINDYVFRPGIGRWAMFSKITHEFVGSFAIIPVEGTDQLQIGYALTPANWGKGYASEALEEGLQYAFNALNLTEIAGITYPENISSQKVLLKSGFVLDKIFPEEGKLLHLYMLKRPNG